MIKLNKFRIKNYKSIIDSGDCYLANGITVLAGKNESGKSSILEALEDFDTEKEVRKDAVRIQNDGEPEIILTFSIDYETLKDFQEDLVIDKNKEVELVICKNFDNEYYLRNSEEIFAKTIELNKKNIKQFSEKSETLEKLIGKQMPLEVNSITNENFLQIHNQISNLEQQIKTTLALTEEELNNSIKQISLLNEIAGDFVNIKEIERELIEDFKTYIPYFILFDTYKDQIPAKVPLNQLNDNEFINDLVKISDLDIELIQDTTKIRENRKHKDKINISISEEYKLFWEQDTANLFLDWDNEFLYFWIKEEDEYYEPRQRSKGRQWHLAFYVKVTARSKDNFTNVILIDEPGLFLHAKAQKNILKKLEKCSELMDLIYSTHSPYLIDVEKLNRVRLIEKSKKEGTRISKIHAKADKETLTPILTAIGEDLSQGIRVDKKNSFVVEGISDYYYLHAFKKLLDSDIEFNIIPGCGDNIPAIGSILFGWGLDPYFILDSDKQKLKNKLHNKLAITEDAIITILEDKKSIENVFSEDDFKKFVLENENTDLSKSLMKQIKENGGKELVARQFLEKVEQGKIKKEKFSNLTNQNIEMIFGKISELLN